MNLTRFLGVCCACLLLIMACAKKQEEADKLEKEMMAQEEPAVEVAPETTAVDTTTPDEQPADYNATPEEVPEPTVQPITTSGDGFTVQVTSCEDLANAQYQIELYERRGYEAYMSSFVHEGQTFYRVRIGQFESLAEAKALQYELIDKFSLEGIWVANYSD